MSPKLALVTQRVVVDLKTGERRDALDQNWTPFLAACGLLAVAAPNHRKTALTLWRTLEPTALVLTGGNDLLALGGDAPERDETELALLRAALQADVPVLAVCRGMQLLLSHFGGALEEVEDHVARRHRVVSGHHARTVNSYHRYGTRRAPTALQVMAMADDGIIEAVEGRDHRLLGLMWHPERETPFDPADIALVRTILERQACAA